MDYKDCASVIYEETMKPDGFLWSIRENTIAEQKFENLIAAIERLTELTKGKREMDKLIFACLFEAPWEIENTMEHYRNKNVDLGSKVSMMADKLRDEVHNLLWSGLEEEYKNIEP